MPQTEEAAQLAAELRVVLTRLLKKMRSQSPTHARLSLTERSIIKLLDKHKALLPSEMAKIEKVTTQSMSQILNKLSGLGYIVRQPQETDRRKVMISLSEQGAALLDTTRNEVEEWLAKAIGTACTPNDLERLRNALGPLTKLVEVE